MEVLFTSSRSLDRAENLKAVWDAYDGGKRYARIDPRGECPEADNAELDGVGVIVTDEFLKRVNGKDRCKVVHIGHGLAGGKSYGLEQPVRYYTREQTAIVDYFVVSSEAGREMAAAQAGIPLERCLALGMPRTDAYFGKSKGDGGTNLAAHGSAYLFAPTMRANYEGPPSDIDFDLVDAMLADGEALYVKRHMLTPNPLLEREYDHVHEVDPRLPSTPFLIDCDVLATDYSSILFDGYLLGKPGVLWCPDADTYLDRRGMGMPYPYGYSSRFSYTERNLVQKLRAARALGMGAVERACLEKTAGACDGRSTERVIDLVRSLLCGY